MHFVIWILGGTLAGWLVGLIMKGRGYGLIWDVALGLLGGVVGAGSSDGSESLRSVRAGSVICSFR